MPYTLEQLQQNDYYQKLKDADRQELLNKFEVESQRYAISGSNAESEHMFARFNQDSLDMRQVAPDVYNISLSIAEEF